MSLSSDSIPTHQIPQNTVVNGMVDYSALPAKRSQSGYWRSARYIIVYGGGGAGINIWSGTGLMLPLLGAFLADSYLGRYRTIVLSSLLYILALGLLTTSAFLDCKGSPDQFDVLFFFASLYLIALGQGAYKPCILAFGADQFDDQDPHELRSRGSFFNWWYFALCAGPLAALLVLNYIQDNISWGIGFGIPCIFMVIALVIFVLGTKSYRYRIKTGDKCAVSRVSQVFVKAAMNWRAIPSTNAYNDEEEQDTVPHLHSQQFKFLNKALLAPDGSVEYEQVLKNIEEVEEAKAILKLIPLWATSLAFAIAIAQPATLFTKQGMTMDRSIGPTLDVPAASLQYIIGLTAIIFIPIYDRAFVPLTRMLTGTSSGITGLQRIGTGMFSCTISLTIAALVEQKRLKTASAYGLTDSPDIRIPMSFGWLIPQYIMYGIAEVFTLIGLQELFYDQVPRSLKAVGLSIFLSIFGMGQFLSSLLICIIERVTSEGGEDGWFSDNTNRAHLDYFYCLLAGLNATGFLAFLYFAISFSSNSSSSSRGNIV